MLSFGQKLFQPSKLKDDFSLQPALGCQCPLGDATGHLHTARKQHLPWHCKHPAVHLVLLQRAAVWKFSQLLCLFLCSRHDYLACCLLHHQILNHHGFWSCHLCLHCDFEKAPVTARSGYPHRHPEFSARETNPCFPQREAARSPR